MDIIKIDPSFVAGLGTDGTLAMLTRTIVQVGHDLGIEIVAEGIERPEQLELLRAMGCGLGQGFLVARPMAARGIEIAGRPGMAGSDAGNSVIEGADGDGVAAAEPGDPGLAGQDPGKPSDGDASWRGRMGLAGSDSDAAATSARGVAATTPAG